LFNVDGAFCGWPGIVAAGRIAEAARTMELPAFSIVMQGRNPRKEGTVNNLLYYAIVFLVVALVAAFLGFGGVAGVAMDGARILFWVAIVLFVVSLIAGVIRRT